MLLSRKIIEQLDALQPIWSWKSAINADKYSKHNVRLLGDYVKLHGDCDIHHKYVSEDGTRLGRWFWKVLSHIRARLDTGGFISIRFKEDLVKTTGLTADYFIELANKRTNKSVRESSFEKLFSTIKEKENTDFDWYSNPALRRAVNCLRKRYNSKTMTKEQIKRCESIKGFKWRSTTQGSRGLNHAGWRDSFEKLKIYVRDNNVKSINDIRFGNRFYYFISMQKLRYRRKELSDPVIKALESLPCWSWGYAGSTARNAGSMAPTQKFLKNISLLKNRIKKGEIKSIKDDVGSYDPSFCFITCQKLRYRGKLLPESCQKMLEDLPGWTWDKLKTGRKPS